MGSGMQLGSGASKGTAKSGALVGQRSDSYWRRFESEGGVRLCIEHLFCSIHHKNN